MNNMGKAKYIDWLTEDGLLLIESWAQDGLTQEDIAANMGIALSTLKVWRNDYPAISAALKKGKEIADYRIENALYTKALGYTMEVQTPFKTKHIEYDPETGKKISEHEEVVHATKTIHVPADVTAMIFWLKNRRPDKWNDRAKVTVSADVEDLTPLAELLKD